MRHVVTSQDHHMPKTPDRSPRRTPVRRSAAVASRATDKPVPVDTSRLLVLDNRLYAYLLDETLREPELIGAIARRDAASAQRQPADRPGAGAAHGPARASHRRPARARDRH